MNQNPKPFRVIAALLLLIPIATALFVWASPLSFIPVPWPDDSAFYFVAKHLFAWPPRWVMLPQAPFEPSYAIFNFNTMPLYPILIGLGRFVGIDGSHLLKLWPLMAWGLTGALLAWALLRKGLRAPFVLFLIATMSLDPEMRWASVLVRPESLIGLFGTALVLGVTLGFPERWQAGDWWRGSEGVLRRLWDPIAALLVLAAYCHFNAVHLIFPAVVGILILCERPFVRLMDVGWKSVLYLSPWLLMVARHFDLFTIQMQLQWKRLAVPNAWLSSLDSALGSLFQSMGSPEPWPDYLKVCAVGLWIILLGGVLWAVTEVLLARRGEGGAGAGAPVPTSEPHADAREPAVAGAGAGLGAEALLPTSEPVVLMGAGPGPSSGGDADESLPTPNPSAGTGGDSPESGTADEAPSHKISLLPAAAWILSACWLWNSKPEVWFTYYIHLSIWVFAGLALLKLQREGRLGLATALSGILLIPMAGAFGMTAWSQYQDLSRSRSWRWSTYEDYVGCVDARLTQLFQAEGRPEQFEVWAPTFPDITIALSRRHPDWTLTRTNDFWNRVPLAIEHGRAVDAVVVTEMLNWAERDISAPMAEHPEIRSVWMNWQGYYLHQFLDMPGWKPNRYLCQRGRWQAFLYMKPGSPESVLRGAPLGAPAAAGAGISILETPGAPAATGASPTPVPSRAAAR